MVPIKQSLVSADKYQIKCPYEMEPEGITVHNTANNAPAVNEINYMKSNNLEKSFHFAIDDKEIIQGLPLDRNGWHAGDGNGDGNRKTISVEICYSTGDKAKFEKAQENAAEFIASKLKEKGWGLDRVYTHKHWSGKHCPHRTLDEYGWDYFLKLVDKYLNPVKELYRVAKEFKNGKYVGQIGAFSVKDNAINMCKANNGYNVFDSKGNIIYSNVDVKPVEPPKPQPQPQPEVKPQPQPQPQPTKNNITYQVWDDVRNTWLPNVVNNSDYAGIYGHDVCGVYANLDIGNITYAVHVKGGQWLPQVVNRKDYAGIFNKPIDGLMMKTDNGTIHYQVHLRRTNKWLPYVTGYNANDGNNGYAGIFGQEIDAIRAYID